MFSLLATAGTTDSSGETLTDQAVSKVNAFQRFWDGIDWDAILAAFIQKSLYLIFLIVLFWILHRVGKYLIDKSFNQYSKKAILNESRLKTLHSLLNTIFHYTLGFFFYLCNFICYRCADRITFGWCRNCRCGNRSWCPRVHE